ncbi:MAG: IS110 family transposase [Terriglobia bacterium]
MLHVGVDLHKRFSQVAILDQKGVITEQRIEHQGTQMEEFLCGLEPGSQVAVEATGSWHWFVDMVESTGHQVHLSHPKQTKAIAHARLKNDRMDAERLAYLLRADLLPTVWIPPVALRHAKELLRHRVLLLRFRTALRNSLGALLQKRNLQPPRGTLFTRSGYAYLNQVPLNAEAEHIRENNLALLKRLDETIGQLDRELQQQVKQDPVARRLMTLPGIGAQTAFALITFIGQIERFPSAKHLASYFGLAPRVHTSANRTRRGHITKEGDRLMRFLLVEAAGIGARKPGPLRDYYRRIVHHKGKAKARVVLARKLVGIVYHVWRDGLDYCEFLQREARQRVSP